MRKSYSQLRVERETADNFRKKAKKMNEELKKIGLKNKKITQIDILKMLSKRPIFLDNEELIGLTRGKIKKI